MGKIRDYLAENNYSTLDSNRLANFLSHTDSSSNSVIVFASNYFPATIKSSGKNSLLRRYLNNGGRIVILGHNPLVYKTDSLTRLAGFDFTAPAEVLGINYGPNDLRSMNGIQPAFPTDEGKKWGLPSFWTAFLPLKESQVDIVLGKNENGLASAWVKKFSSLPNSGFIQAWMSNEGLFDVSCILKIAEHS